MMSNAGVAHMERCVECIDEVARLAPEGGPLAAYRILPQVLEYVRSMRDPFYLSLQTGELRGIIQVELTAGLSHHRTAFSNEEYHCNGGDRDAVWQGRDAKQA